MRVGTRHSTGQPLNCTAIFIVLHVWGIPGTADCNSSLFYKHKQKLKKIKVSLSAITTGFINLTVEPMEPEQRLWGHLQVSREGKFRDINEITEIQHDVIQIGRAHV